MWPQDNTNFCPHKNPTPCIGWRKTVWPCLSKFHLAALMYLNMFRLQRSWFKNLDPWSLNIYSIFCSTNNTIAHLDYVKFVDSQHSFEVPNLACITYCKSGLLFEGDLDGDLSWLGTGLTLLLLCTEPGLLCTGLILR